MKQLLILMLTISIASISNAQHQSIEQFYEKYMGMKNVSNISIDGSLLNMVVRYSDDENGNEKASSLSKLRVLLMNEVNYVSKTDKIALKKAIKRDQFEELLQIRDGSCKIDALIREKGNKITNILLIVDDVDQFILLSLEGMIDWEQLKKLELNVEGGEHLKKVTKC